MNQFAFIWQVWLESRAFLESNQNVNNEIGRVGNSCRIIRADLGASGGIITRKKSASQEDVDKVL